MEDLQFVESELLFCPRPSLPALVVLRQVNRVPKYNTYYVATTHTEYWTFLPQSPP